MVCLCEGVSERKVRKSIEHGASTIDQVTEACRAGGRCGGCRPTIDTMLSQHAEVDGRRIRLSIA
jgi:bacterioferritin-associated ferredoxin